MLRRYELRLLCDSDRQLWGEQHHASLDLASAAGLAAASPTLDQQGRGMANRANVPYRNLDRCYVEVIDPETDQTVHRHYLSGL